MTSEAPPPMRRPDTPSAARLGTSASSGSPTAFPDRTSRQHHPGRILPPGGPPEPDDAPNGPDPALPRPPGRCSPTPEPCTPNPARRTLPGPAAARPTPSRTHLPAHVLQREPEHLSGRLDVHPRLRRRSTLERVGDVVHAGEAAQAVLQAFDGHLQLHRVRPDQLHVDPLRPAAGRTPRTRAPPLPQSGRSAPASAGPAGRPSRRARPRARTPASSRNSDLSNDRTLAPTPRAPARRARQWPARARLRAGCPDGGHVPGLSLVEVVEARSQECLPLGEAAMLPPVSRLFATSNVGCHFPHRLA